MNPRLVAINGPLKESTFVLPTDDVSVGRDPLNLLYINDPSVSRRHCVLTHEGGGIKIRDLESRNGTQVNGASIKEQTLKHGDQLAIGDSVFLYLVGDEAEEEDRYKVEFDDDQPTHTTSRIRPQDVLYLQPDKILSELPATSRLARNLNALLKISRVVHSIRELDELQAQILKLTFEVAPAERAAILLDGTGLEHLHSVFARNRLADDFRPVRVSRTIVRQVMEQGVAILGSDIPGSSGFGKVESLIALQVRSLLCVPMTVFERVIGCIYLDSTDPLHRFDDDHLELVTAIAGISAMALENARRLQWLEQENQRLMTELNFERSMLGESPKMKEVFQFLTRAAPTDSTVLIGGESGTGKELAARALHLNSPRAAKPFVAINCAAIPDTLLESELFGYEKGAFTGAVSQKKGRLEVADGGTVFLDEVGEIPPALQVKLLRVLQEREFERVGGNRPIAVDIRLIAASNKDLDEAVKNGSFRRDLYYRLNVVSLTMPALRDRKADIPLLARYFVEKHSAKSKGKAKNISRETMASLMSYDWPGNVRELENAIEHALVLGSSDTILPEDLPETLLETETPAGITAAKYHSAVKNLKKQLILTALEDAKGNYTEAARILGVHPNYLHRLIRNLDLKESLRQTTTRGKFGLQA
ncbi:MAG: sigma-54-dependent Fis family transcriptional regulator [Acidobacteria bacterium]|nr:MAG: sigma-54-dependent Fis family transcriptional regulator [Acidobacteriota bacterium]